MNRENVRTCISVMKRAEARNSVYMPSYQSISNPQLLLLNNWKSIKYSEADFHACGNSACFAGHLAIAPEIQALGFGVEIGTGDLCSPDLKLIGTEALAYLLDIPDELADCFVFGRPMGRPRKSLFYFGIAWEEVKASHVLQRLEELLEKGGQRMLEDFNIYEEEVRKRGIQT